jgi:DNA polymerase-3 subunit gamma/tau
VLSHLRDLVVAKVCGDAGRELLDLADEEVKDVVALAARANADDLTRLFQGFSRGFDDVVRSGQPRAALEMALVRLARRPPLLPIDELLARLGELEKRLGGPPPPPPRTGGPASGPRGAGPGAATKGGAFSASRSDEPPTMLAPTERTRGALALAATPEPVSEPILRAVAEPDATTPTPPPTSVTTLRTTSPSAPEPQSPALDTWRIILERVRAAKPSLASVFERGVPVEVTAQRVLLGFPPDSFLGAQAADAEALDVLTREVRAHFAAATEVALDLSLKTAGPTVASIDAERHREAVAAARAAVEKHPLVAAAIAILGAELKDVRLPNED